MSEEQLNAFWAAVEADASLQETLKGAADLDAAVAVAKEAGFDVSKADLLEYQSQQTLELSDEDLEKVAGGTWKRWLAAGGNFATTAEPNPLDPQGLFISSTTPNNP